MAMEKDCNQKPKKNAMNLYCYRNLKLRKFMAEIVNKTEHNILRYLRIPNHILSMIAYNILTGYFREFHYVTVLWESSKH